MCTLISWPPLVLLDKVCGGMDKGMISAVQRYLAEGGGVGEGQVVVMVTHWDEGGSLIFGSLREWWRC